MLIHVHFFNDMTHLKKLTVWIQVGEKIIWVSLYENYLVSKLTKILNSKLMCKISSTKPALINAFYYNITIVKPDYQNSKLIQL